MKVEKLPRIIERDGDVCLYCPEPFSEINPAEFDHLNNDSSDNRDENLVQCHHACNIRKKFSPEMQFIAKEKLKQNERAISASEKASAILKIEHPEGLTSSQQISQACRPIAKEWLYNHINEEGQVTLSEAVGAIVDACQKRIGWGSQAAIYNHINAWCNRYTGEFTKTKEAGKNVIRIRDEKFSIHNKSNTSEVQS